MDMKKEIGGRIKFLRESRTSLTQPQAASDLGVGVDAYKSWERGVVFPPHDTIVRISDRYGVSIDWIMTGRGSTHRTMENDETAGDGDGLTAISHQEAMLIDLLREMPQDKRERLFGMAYLLKIEK